MYICRSGLSLKLIDTYNASTDIYFIHTYNKSTDFIFYTLHICIYVCMQFMQKCMNAIYAEMHECIIVSAKQYIKLAC